MAAQEELEPAGNATEYSCAFLVGWRLAQLYANPIHTEQIQAVVEEKGYLPVIPKDLTQHQQAQLIWLKLDSDLSELPGGKSPEISKAKTALEALLQNPQYDKGAIATSIENVFAMTLANVYVIHPHLAKALNLGRQLAHLVFGPADAPSVFTTLREQLSKDRVSRARSLLDELQSSFPLRATAAVSGSLMYWQHWVQTRSDAYDAVRKELHRQGEQWRGLLTGEIHADDLLDLQDYRQAFGKYLGQVAGLYRKNPWLWGMALTLLAATGAGIWAIVTYAPKGAAVVAAIIATVAGALGISWKTIAVTVGKAAALLERPMLADGLSEAVKIAAFIPPVDMTSAEIAKLRNEVRKDERQAKERQSAAERLKPAIAASADTSVPPAVGNEAPDVATP